MPSSCSVVLRVTLLLVSLLTIFTFQTRGQRYDSSLYSGLQWRQIGPFRAGRCSAVAGISGNAALYYMGTPGGGVWKTVNSGVTWAPIFDAARVASVGAIAVAPSNPNILYVGTGDVSDVGGALNRGNGVYKSTDGGDIWQHVGLENTWQIGNMWIDPQNADIVVVAALGQTFAPNPERGIFKTTDGGKTWRKVLFKDDSTGAIDVVFAANNKNVGFAALWTHAIQPGNPQQVLNTLKGGFIYKTSDGGETWTPVPGDGLPGGNLGRIGVAVSNDGQRVFAIMAAEKGGNGLFRSDDSGAHWTRSTTDPRVKGSGYFSRVFIDPQHPDVVYVAQTSLYRSQDGGKTFIAYKGAPGGDDNHALWIDSQNSERIIMASDQGATISMDGGKSWSSWYNQPTGQIYHLSTDNREPYWVYGTQQDSGSIGTLSRGDYGKVTFLDWDPVGGYEFGYILADPLNPNLVYAGGPARGLVRINRTNRQVDTISPNVSKDGDYRVAVNPPLAFSPQDPHTFYEGTQFLLETQNAGVNWNAISPDLTKRPGSEAENQEIAEQDAKAAADNTHLRTKEAEETLKPPDRTAINTFSPSPAKSGEIWAGTTDGLIQLTTDNGGSWQNVSPGGLSRWTLVSIVEASHFDAGTCYAAIDRHEENDYGPHIYRTSDYGKSWQETVTGIPAEEFVRVVREDPQRKGLLYAGTENATYVSFDNGDHWSSLRLNMPVTSVRDLAVHGNDLVAATYGRAFWILDDVTPLRQTSGQAASDFLYKPEKALRIRRDLNQDTPLPPEMPAGDNPPDGALIDYYLKSAPQDNISMGIYDEAGNLVRQLSSNSEAPSSEPPPNVPEYWVAHPEPLPKNAGMNRFVWDLHYAAPPVIRHEYPISAVYESTPGEPEGELALPGKYQVRLTVNGKTYTQPLELALDPRVDVSNAALEKEFELEKKVVSLVRASYGYYHEAALLREALANAQKTNAPSGQLISALKDFDAKAFKIEGSDTDLPAGGGRKPKPSFVVLNRELGSLAPLVDGSDAAPTPSMVTAYQDYCHDLTNLSASWNELIHGDLEGLDQQLRKQGRPPLTALPLTAPACQ